MAQKQRGAKNMLPSQSTRKTPGGFSSRGAALLADLKLMHLCDEVVISTLGFDDQVQLPDHPAPRQRTHVIQGHGPAEQRRSNGLRCSGILYSEGLKALLNG